LLVSFSSSSGPKAIHDRIPLLPLEQAVNELVSSRGAWAPVFGEIPG